MNFGNTTELGGYRSIVVGGIGWMQSAFSWIPNPIALKNENAWKLLLADVLIGLISFINFHHLITS